MYYVQEKGKEVLHGLLLLLLHSLINASGNCLELENHMFSISQVSRAQTLEHMGGAVFYSSPEQVLYVHG